MKTRRNTSHFSSSYVEIGWDGCVEDWTQLRSLGATASASVTYAWHKHLLLKNIVRVLRNT